MEQKIKNVVAQAMGAWDGEDNWTDQLFRSLEEAGFPVSEADSRECSAVDPSILAVLTDGRAVYVQREDLPQGDPGRYRII